MRLLPLYAIPLFVFSCNQLNREDFLAGRFGKVDVTAPDLIAPRQNERLTTAMVANLTFAWSMRSGVSEYTLQIATDPNFVTIIAERSAAAPEYKADAALAGVLQNSDFYWRVRGDNGSFASATRFRVEHNDTIFVDVNATATGNSGNRTNPLTSINEAVLLAQATKNLFEPAKIREIWVAQGTYNSEIISLLSGIKITGSYSGTTWVQDTALYKSTLRASTGSTIVVSIIGVQDVTIDGFEIAVNNNLNETIGVLIQNAGNIEIKNSSVQGGGGLEPKAVALISTGNVAISNSTLIGGLAGTGSNFGIHAHFASQLAVENSTIRPADGLAGTLNQVGIYMKFSYLNISHSTVYGGNTSSGQFTRAIWLEYSNARIIGNTIYSSDPNSNDASIQGYSLGIALSDGTPWDSSVNGNQTVLIANNVIIGMYALYAAEAIVTNAANAGGGCGGARRIYAVNNTIIMRNNISGGGQAAINMAQVDRCWEIRNNLMRAEAQPSNYSIALLDSSTVTGTNPLLRHNLIVLGNWSSHYYRQYNPGPVTHNISDNGDFTFDAELDPHTTAVVSGNRTTNQTAVGVFLAPASSDYRLNAASAALTIGENLYNVSPFGITDDRSATARPTIGGWSIGAYH
jgi:hypothetical protein